MEFAASLIAVVGLADQVIRCCSLYISAVKDCPSDVRVLLVETSTLKSVIGNLEILHKTNSNPVLEQLFATLAGKDGPVKGCRDCLAEIDKLLPDDRAQEIGDDQSEGGTGTRKKRRALQPTIERLAWPLRETKAKKLVDELRRFRESISLALVMDLSRASRQIDSKLQQLSDQLDEQSREKILEWLTVVDPSGYHNTISAMREKHTGLWLDKSPEYRAWKNDQGSSPLIWFHGIPGAGKTVLFSHIVEDVRTHCRTIKYYSDLPSICIYYYCYFGRNQDESLPLLRWILSQLARRAKYVPRVLKDLFDSGHQPDSEAVFKALSELSQQFTTIYVLVDGLDESANRGNILRVMRKLRESDNLRLLAMSREENDIKEAMKRICAKTVSLSNKFVDEDIATYIKSELADNARLSLYPQGLKQEIETSLVRGARGMFRWASCQLEVLSRLHTISDIRKALGDLPRGLDATYERILLSIPEEHKQRAKKALLLLAGGKLSFERPRANVLAEAIMVDIENETFDPSDRILEPQEFISETCTCLVRVDETDPKSPRLLLAHYTVKEYLYSDRIKDSPAAYFYSSDELTEYQTSMVSLVYLLNISYQGIPSTREFLSASPAKQQAYAASVNNSYPLLEAASSAWLSSLGSDIQKPALRAEVESLLLRLFYPSPKHFRWISWRALTIADDDWIHPVWSPSSLSEANPHDVALTVACSFDQPTIVSMILAAKKREQDLSSTALSNSNHNTNLTLEESYAGFWTEIYRNTIDPHPESENPLEDFDIHVHPEDYLPSGTPLEIALRFEAIECTRLLLVNSSPAIDLSSHITTTPSGLRLSILSVALKTCPNSVQTDFREDYLGMLIELGANVNPPTTTEQGGDGVWIVSVTETPLQSAVMLVHVEAVSILLDAGADVNAVGDCGCYHRKGGRNKADGDDESDIPGGGMVGSRQTVSERNRTSCWGHKSPLRIVREIMAARGVEESEVENLLRLHGALDFDLGEGG